MADLPTGTVTFLFTDVEGSTTRWEQHRETMQVALARHDAILRQAIEGHGGVVFKTVGDAFCAAFKTAPDALAAALAAQQALQSEPWPENLAPVRVRMALHTGAAEERDGDYFGPPLNRVARLLSAGHGGEILLSVATQGLIRDQLPPTVELRDLGVHRLKDLQQPERIFQVIAPDVLADFPPLKTLDARPNNLPIQRSPIIGRERDVATVTALLQRDDVGLVTLLGPGGVGKTRLSLQVAADVLDDFPDGVWLVNLAPISDPALVAATIAQTLGVKEAAGQSLTATLTTYLRQKHLLLLLDNFEQVVEAVPLVADLLAGAPHLKLLVTSRQALRLSGEHEYPVPPLALPDLHDLPPLYRLSQYAAVALFIERATAVQPDFRITNATAGAVAEICARLDGLPLAIELAAARSKLLPPDALLQRLSSRLKLLTGGARDLPARQQTLHAAIDWSYSLLESGEQTLFARLAVFVGGCTVEAVEAVCNAEGDLVADVLDGMASLLDKSLLQLAAVVEGEPRFAMLETIREYAREQLRTRGELAVLRQQHAAYYLGLVEGAAAQFREEPLGEQWLTWIRPDQDNLRAALQWALDQRAAEGGLRLAAALGLAWWWQLAPQEGRRWLAALLALPGPVPAPIRARALSVAASLEGQFGEATRAKAWAEESLRLCHQLGDTRGIAWALLTLGHLAAAERTGQAPALIEEGLARFVESGDPEGIERAVQGYRELVELAEQPGAAARVQGLLEQSLAHFRQQGNLGASAMICRCLGELRRDQGDYAQGRSWLEESLRLHRQLGDRLGVAITLNDLGELALMQDDDARAQALEQESLELLRALGEKTHIVFALINLGYVAQHQGARARAYALGAESVRLARELGFSGAIIESLEGVVGAVGAERTARLLGAVAAQREARQTQPMAARRRELDHIIAATRAQLDEATWEAAWAEGRAMPLEQAIAYALEEAPDA